MQTYEGGCHCGQVRFSIESDLEQATQCNCSICTKKGTLNHRVPPERFRILQGENALGLYQFNTFTARHWFCKRCGIAVFSNPRRAPDQYAVNLRCLDAFYSIVDGLTITRFDGQHWEESVRSAEAARGTA
jgi:hypothetical protein